MTNESFRLPFREDRTLIKGLEFYFLGIVRRFANAPNERPVIGIARYNHEITITCRGGGLGLLDFSVPQNDSETIFL